ncbi:TPA: undecaprenyl/decaprenyl-phosphate alpha-N-acetylglucosaminyl 1-phosphate transferase [bacterium]|nr:undecaprenyl/decaprenyl-phosphate alpha-N-acetylglucosaminyl 1-phosphate transferase [bacterium]
MISLYIAIFFTSLLGALIGTPIVRKIALKFRIIDIPSHRKIHLEPIPLLGGISIAVVFLLAFSLFSKLSSEMLAVFLGSLIIILTGLTDDIKGLSPFLKLSLQILACWLVVIFGISVSFTNNPAIDIPITFLWIVGITNAFNLLDNMDGLSVGIAGIASFFFFLLSFMEGQFLIASLSITLSGACFGFLRYNFSPAQIFMGDTGSMFVGFILSIIGIKLRFAESGLFSFAIPIIVLGLPIFDTTLVTISRLISGKKVSEGGRDHTSHRLVLLGLSHAKAVLSLYFIGIILGTFTLILSRLIIPQVFIVLLFLVLFLFGLVFFGRIKSNEKKEKIKQNT